MVGNLCYRAFGCGCVKTTGKSSGGGVGSAANYKVSANWKLRTEKA